MNSLNLIVKNKNVGTLKINYEELKVGLVDLLSKYKDLVVTEESLAVSKQDRAYLNNLSTLIDNRRKELKKEFLAPYEEVEKQFKELTKLINDVSVNIGDQIKEFDNAEKRKKKAEIEDYYNSINAKVPLGRIFDERWLNKTMSLKSVMAEIDEALGRIDRDLEVIISLAKEPDKAKVLQAKYLVSLDLRKTIDDYEKEQKALESLNELRQMEVETPNFDSGVSKGVEVDDSDEDLYELAFSVKATKKQILELRKFLDTNSYLYKKID